VLRSDPTYQPSSDRSSDKTVALKTGTTVDVLAALDSHLNLVRHTLLKPRLEEQGLWFERVWHLGRP
jgi:hypothetical protein